MFCFIDKSLGRRKVKRCMLTKIFTNVVVRAGNGCFYSKSYDNIGRQVTRAKEASNDARCSAYSTVFI